MEVIIWTPADSPIVAVTYPASKYTAQQIIDKGDIPADALNVEIVDESTLPTEQTFRDAWRQQGNGKIGIDMAAARKLWKRAWGFTIRHRREVMTDADITAVRGQMVALEQVLANANSINAIKALWPDDLGPPVVDFEQYGIGEDESGLLE